MPADDAAHRASARQPVAGDDRVGIEQHDVGARQQHSAVRGSGKAAVAPVAQQHDVRQRASRERGEVRGDGGIGRRVVDQHQPVAAIGVREHALDAALEIVDGVVDRNDDVDRRIVGRRDVRSVTSATSGEAVALSAIYLPGAAPALRNNSASMRGGQRIERGLVHLQRRVLEDSDRAPCSSQP